MVRRLVGGLGGSRLGRRGAEEGPLGRRRGGQQVTCLAQHQTQGHLVACGAASGQLSLWDLRQTRLATVTLTAPTQGALAEMLFHPDDGSLLFCAHDGSLLRWASPGGCPSPSSGLLQAVAAILTCLEAAVNFWGWYFENFLQTCHLGWKALQEL